MARLGEEEPALGQQAGRLRGQRQQPGQRRAGARQLNHATWVLREPGSGTREASDRWLIPHLKTVEVELELGSNRRSSASWPQDWAWGALSRLAVKEAIAEGWLVELATTLPPMQRTLSIVLHRAKKLGAAAEGFLRHCTTD